MILLQHRFQRADTVLLRVDTCLLKYKFDSIILYIDEYKIKDFDAVKII